MRALLLIVCVIAGFAAAAYIGVTYWIDEYGDLTRYVREESDGMTRREDVYTLLIAATDEGQERADSIMVATFDFQEQTVGVLNIPRDTLVDTEREADGKKINAAFGGGIQQLSDEVASVIGFKPDSTMVLNFEGIAAIVDAIGGIDYTVPFDMNYHDKSQGLSIELKEGLQHLNGKQTVEFLRWRHNDDGTGYEDGDVGRVQKLQEFLKVFASEVFQPENLIKLPQMIRLLGENVDTDLTQAQLAWLALQGMQMDMSEVHTDTLIGDNARIDINMGYCLWYYVLDEEMVLDQINESFSPYSNPITDLDIVTPDTIPGAVSPNWIEEKSYRYAMAGLEFHYEPPVSEEDSVGYTEQSDAGDLYDSTDSYDEYEDYGGYDDTDEYDSYDSYDDEYDVYDDYDDTEYSEDW